MAKALLQRVEAMETRPLMTMPVKDMPVMQHQVQPDVLKLAAKYLGVVRPRGLVNGNGHGGKAGGGGVKRLGRKGT